MIPFPFNENRFSSFFFFFFFFFCCRPSTTWPVVYKSQERWELSIMSESDTLFNERDRRCAAVQLMLSTDPSYDNWTITSSLKMQIWIGTNNRGVPRVMKTKFPATVMVFGVVSSEGHIMPPHIFEVGLKANTNVYLDVLKSVVIRWPVADPGCGSRTRCYDFFILLSLVPSSPDLNPLDYFVWSYVENIPNMTSHNTKASLIAVIRRVFAELPPALVEKVCSQFRIRIEVVIEAEGSYIEEMSALLYYQVTWIDFFDTSFKIRQ